MESIILVPIINANHNKAKFAERRCMKMPSHRQSKEAKKREMILKYTGSENPIYYCVISQLNGCYGKPFITRSVYGPDVCIERNFSFLTRAHKESIQLNCISLDDGFSFGNFHRHGMSDKTDFATYFVSFFSTSVVGGCYSCSS